MHVSVLIWGHCINTFNLCLYQYLNSVTLYALEALEDSLASYSALNGGFVRACLKVARLFRIVSTFSSSLCLSLSLFKKLNQVK